MKILIIFLLMKSMYTADVDYGTNNDLRKHYGLSFDKKCKEIIKVFACLSACKAIAFQVYRLDFQCKCYCHELKTTTILPFFKWRTNGTTRKMQTTRSPRLYEMVGTYSRPSYPTDTTVETSTCPTIPAHILDLMKNKTSNANDTSSVSGASNSSSTVKSTNVSKKSEVPTSASSVDAAPAAETTAGS